MKRRKKHQRRTHKVHSWDWFQIIAIYGGFALLLYGLLYYFVLSKNPTSPTNSQAQTAKGKPCGGFAGETGKYACPNGYVCKYPKPHYPDQQGQCVKQYIISF